MEFDTKEFRNCMGEFATGVCVVTNKSNNELYGVTINSFTSVSLDPFLVLYCIDKNADNYQNIVEFESFNINILSSSQENLSNLFAKPSKVNWQEIDYNLGEYKNPVLKESNAVIECKTHKIYDGGDHSIIIGAVEKFKIDSDSNPLIYYKGQYFK